MTSDIHVAVISDIHLGHHRTKTDHILNNLRVAFPDTEETGKLRVIFFAGDVFDRLLTFPSESTTAITYWIMEFLDICRRRNVMVRILEGTPSHDWKQSRIFDTVNRAMGALVDLKYVESLSIERIADLGIDVLYVPDEWAPEADDVWKQTTDLLRSSGLDKVDLAIMHGAFDYQIPMSHNTHSPERYLSIVKHYVFIGHVHIHSTFNRILAQGSFDRLSHGEEGPKGHLRATIRHDGHHDFKFIQNFGAKVYKTIDVQDLPLNEVILMLKEFQDFPSGSCFRLRTKRTDETIGALDTIKDLYPQFTWTTLTEESERKSEEIRKDSTIPQPITVTRDNVVELVTARLPELDQKVEKKLFALLEQIR